MRRTIFGLILGGVLFIGCGGGPTEGSRDLGLLPDRSTSAVERVQAAPPAFARFGDVEVTVDGSTVPLGESRVRYQRGAFEAFDDPATVEFEAVHHNVRSFLACDTDRWSMGVLSYAADLVDLGVHRDNLALIEKGVASLDWATSVPTIDDSGVHTLTRSCDDTTAQAFGGTHHTAQWIQGLGRAVYVLAASEYSDEYLPEIDRYIESMEEASELLVRDDNWAQWEEQWLLEDDGDIFTHKTYMMAAALGTSAVLTNDPKSARDWAGQAAEIAERGMENQREDGVNPERGGHDVTYQAYGTWLAQVYLGTLAPDDPLRAELTGTIDRAIEWLEGRTDPKTGNIDIEGSTRTCSELEPDALDVAPTVRVFLVWGNSEPGREDLIERAAEVHQAARTYGNACPS